MRRFAVAVLLAQAFSVSADTGQSDAVGELLSSARLWVDKKRDDLATLALKKLLSINPDQTDALLMLGEIELRLDHREQAQKLLQQLQSLHPDHLAGHQLAEAYRIATTDRKTMAMIRLLARSGKDEEAAILLRQLFPQGNPGGDLGVEYSRIMAVVRKQQPQPQLTKIDTISDSSRFWQLIASANSALEKRQLLKAENLAKAALRLFKHNPEATLTLANIDLAMNNPTKAEMLYRKTLDIKPTEDRALRGMIRILVASGRRGEAIGFIENFVEAHPESAGNFAQPRASLLRDEADALLNSGQIARALIVLENGVRAMPTQAWLRFDLAGLYKRQGLPDLGRILMAEGVNRAPDDPEIAYAQAIYLSSLGDEDGVLASLQAIPSEKSSAAMRKLARKAEVRSKLNHARSDYLTGKRQLANSGLDVAEQQSGNDAELLWEVAKNRISNGQTEKGLKLSSRLRLSAPQSDRIETTLRYAELLDDAKQDEELTSLLDAIPESAIVNGRQKQNILDLRRTSILRRSATLTKQNKVIESRQVLEQGLKKGLSEDPRLLMALADNLEESGDLPAAKIIYRQVASHNPTNYDARLSLVRMQIRLDDTTSVREELHHLDNVVPMTAVDTRLGIARQFSALQEHADARRIAKAVGNTNLDDSSVQMQVGRIEKSAGRYEQALRRFDLASQIALKQPAANIELSSARQAIDSIKQRRYGYITGGFDRRQLNGTRGISEVTNDEYPLLMRYPFGYQGHFFAQLDYSTISAGKLNLADFNEAGLFGKIQALGANRLQGLSDQTASGVAFGIGYESDSWRFDAGTTPQGYPLSYWVGGIKKTGNIGNAYYMLDLSRRPMINSLLSYAGVHDPVTGDVWGGVRKNGVEFYSGYDIGRLGLFVQGGGHYLDGVNVKSNTSIMGRTGADWALINDTDMRLTAGFALMYLANGNNRQHYTYGHGGYWSPQDYKSISFPLQWTGRFHKLSYLFRGSGSYSISKQNSADFYPTDRALQLSAYDQPLPSGYDRPVYDGSSSTAFGYSLTGMLEYQVEKQWFLGARMEIARSPFYTPNFTTFYFRYDFEPRNRPISFPPKPVKPYDRY